MANSSQQVAVDLDVGGVALGRSEQAASASVKSAGSGGKSRPWKRFQVIARTAWQVALRIPSPASRDPALPHRRGALAATSSSALLDRALELKAGRASGEGADALAGRSVALIFEKPSTRTRVSFEVGVAELGGTPLVLRGDELQLARGESVADTARVLSRYVHAIVDPGRLARGGRGAGRRGASVPVINALTPHHHPCQALADLHDAARALRRLWRACKLAYVGDGNNVARSLAHRSARIGRRRGEGRLARRATGSSRGSARARHRRPARGRRRRRRGLHRRLGEHGRRGRRGAPPRRPRALPGQRRAARARASDERSSCTAFPPIPGEEITEDVLYGERSAVWDQAENRLHAQKALLELLLS